MRKKITVNELRLGMFIDKLDGNWLQHPFWKTSFKLENPKNITALKESAVTHVWIDISKGLDVAKKDSGKSEEPLADEENTAAKETVNTVALKEEMAAAKETLAKAKQATMEMLQEARMGNSVTAKDVAPIVDEISQSVSRNSNAMLTVTRMKSKDDYTYLHSVAVCALMIALGKQINYQGDFHSLGMAGLLHDVGKMAIPDEVLNKPGKLTDEEFDIVKNHPVSGWEILKNSDDVDEIALDVCLHHHERVDGKGYPDKLSGDKLSLVARMAAVCDVYDAITSNRCYKDGWAPADALKKMAEWKDGHFDEQIFQAFVKTVGIYPSGTLVKLKSNRLAVVMEQGHGTLLKPVIKIFYSCSHKAPIPNKVINLSASNEVIDCIESAEDWDLKQEDLINLLGE